MSDPNELPFRIEWLASAAQKKPAVTVCEIGHLVINGNSHWQVDRFSPDLSALWCRLAGNCCESA